MVRTNKLLPFRELLRFGKAYWFLLLICVAWYSVILAFRSTFSIMYFQQVRHLDLAAAGAINSYVFLAALVATPAFGWLCDRIGRYAPMLALGALLLPVALAILAFTHWSLWVATALIGVSYSAVPAVMWPLTSKLVSPERFGTALGLMWVVQNAGIFAANVMAGWLNDGASASAQNPAGYQPMMVFFCCDECARLRFLAAALDYRWTATPGSRDAAAPERDCAIRGVEGLPTMGQEPSRSGGCRPRTASRIAHHQPNAGDQEIEGAKGGVRRDYLDAGGGTVAAFLKKKAGDERRLAAAQDHRPLRAVGFPTPNAGHELRDASEERPDTENHEYRLHADGEGRRRCRQP